MIARRMQSCRHNYQSAKRCSSYAADIDYNRRRGRSGMTRFEQDGACDEEIHELLTYYCAAAVHDAKAGAGAATSVGERTPAIAEPRRAMNQECPRVEHIRAQFRWMRQS